MADKEYVDKALNFLISTQTDMKIEFFKTDRYFDDDKVPRDIYKVTLTRGDKTFTFKFGNSLNATEKGEKPTEYDILACLTKYEVGSFENFCGDYGYDEDSRKAEKIYQAVLNEWNNVKEIWNEEELERLREIE